MKRQEGAAAEKHAPGVGKVGERPIGILAAVQFAGRCQRRIVGEQAVEEFGRTVGVAVAEGAGKGAGEGAVAEYEARLAGPGGPVGRADEAAAGEADVRAVA